ncbi:MAG: hypothetical protein J6E44_08025 [Lachnospiraceae bacterium]|nr:hypothetical protein [Lachnospiraceae bacterium]
MFRKMTALLTAGILAGSSAAVCVSAEESSMTTEEEQAYIEQTLNLRENSDQEWSYEGESGAWILAVTPAVAYPEIPDEQGVSVCVPGAYVKGVDTDGDGEADVTGETAEDSVKGSLVIDYEAEVTSTHGQIYTAASAPVIFNTGAAGYSEQQNRTASSEYAAEGYINVACGNRGKQSTVTREDGTVEYTGDAPSCLVDQKCAARFVKYNILLGNLPGSPDYFVSTGGSGGGAHAVMFAATANQPDFFDYEIEAGAVGIYKIGEDYYSSGVTIDGEYIKMTDGAWGCVAYSPITSLAEADMALAFEYYLDGDYAFNTPFQKKMAEYLSEEYMEYINGQELTAEEEKLGFDLDGDGKLESTVSLAIEYDPDKYPDTNGYGGTYTDLYLAQMESGLQWYLDHLSYAEGWTWFDEEGQPLSDEEVSGMSEEDMARAFIEGRYTAADSGRGGMRGGMGGRHPGGFSGAEMPEGMRGGEKNGGMPGGGMPGGDFPGAEMGGGMQGGPEAGGMPGGEMEAGTPDMGTTQSSGSSMDSANYETFEELVAAYEADIAEVTAGDRYGYNQVDLYNPLNYIMEANEANPVWTRMVMGASEGDISMFNSLNLRIAWLNAGVDASLEWQWNGGHVPSEIFGNSLALTVDEKYGEYVEGAAQAEASLPEKATENGTSESPEGTDISSWVDAADISSVAFTLADAANYRTAGASKATPGFDVIDYGQEDYVFGNAERDARHWDVHVLNVLEKYADVLVELFNGGTAETVDSETERAYEEAAEAASEAVSVVEPLESYAELIFDEEGNQIFDAPPEDGAETTGQL